MRAIVAALLVLVACAGVTSAQERPGAPVQVVVGANDTPEAIGRIVGELRRQGHEVVVQWQAAPAHAAAPHAPPEAAMNLVQSFLTGTARGFAALPALLAVPGDIADRLRADPALGSGIAWALALIALAVAAAWAARLAVQRFVPHPPVGPRFIDRLGVALIGLVYDVATVAVFYAAAAGLASLAPPASAMAAGFGQGLAGVAAGVGLYLAAGRFVLAPGDPAARLLAMPNAERTYRFYAIYAFAPTIFGLAALIGAVSPDRRAVAALIFVGGTIINLYKVWWFWTTRHDVLDVVRTTGADPARPSATRRALAWVLLGLLLVLPFLLVLSSRLSAVMADAVEWAAAGALSQVALIVVPLVAAGVAAATRDLLGEAAADRRAWLARATRDVGATVAAGAVYVVGLVLLAQAWSGALAWQSEALREFTRAAIAAGIVVVVGWAILRVLQAFFDAHTAVARVGVPGEEAEDEESTTEGRLATAIPLIRNLVLGAVGGLTLLIALSTLGVDIAPLLAGAGVLGLAISFGSQALVRDIVSGIFFMADDAFRVGEYIDTGRLKGTVERISLRSVRLRHQSGQVHTIPFGQLTAITNASRDWATVKFNLRLDRDANLEQARKAIKKVGVAMQADPEFAKEFIQPLKLQGVAEIADNALVVRLKFTAKPARTSWIQRESLKRVYAALQEAGVPFASSAVTVKGGSAEQGAAAARSSRAEPAPQPG